MNDGRSKCSTGTAENFLRYTILFRQRFIRAIGYCIDFELRDITLPDYETAVDLRIARKRTDGVFRAGFKVRCKLAVIGRTWTGLTTVVFRLFAPTLQTA